MTRLISGLGIINPRGGHIWWLTDHKQSQLIPCSMAVQFQCKVASIFHVHCFHCFQPQRAFKEFHDFREIHVGFGLNLCWKKSGTCLLGGRPPSSLCHGPPQHQLPGGVSGEACTGRTMGHQGQVGEKLVPWKSLMFFSDRYSIPTTHRRSS